MDLSTAAAIVGIVAAVVYVAETAHKYSFALLKKFKRSHMREKVTHLFKKVRAATTPKRIHGSRPLVTTSLKSVVALLDTGARQILLVDLDPLDSTNLNRLTSSPGQYAFKKNL